MIGLEMQLALFKNCTGPLLQNIALMTVKHVKLVHSCGTK